MEKVLCPSKAANGKQCGFELISLYKRCPICEVRVDQAWFQSETQLPDKHLDSNGETSTSIRTDLGNPLAQNDSHSPNVDTETTERGEKDQNDTGKTTEDGGVKGKDSVEDLRKEGGEGVRDERRDDGNRKRKKEEEDEGGGLRSKEIRKENVDDTEEKRDMKDGEERKEDGSRGDPGQEIEEQITDRVRTGDGVGNQAGKEDGVAGREKREVGNEKNRDEGEDEEGRPRSDPLLISSANGSTSTSDPLVAIPKNTVQKDKNQKNEQNTPTSSKTGQHTDDSTANKKKETVKVCFHAFLAPTVDFNHNIDELYVVFGPERNDWNCKEEGLMKFCRSNSNKNDTKDGIPVSAVVELEKILLRKPGLSYRYCFRRKGNKSMENEFFFQQYYPYHSNYRRLIVPSHFGNLF
uniref:Uncharacterized protein n=1 Tax=Magallana gigas TaxID=29159 RepID=K1RKF6_MAGGI